MEVYNKTGVTKSGQLRITKSIGSLLLTSTRTISELSNERISIWVERSKGNNLEIAKNVLLKHFIFGCTYGESLISGDTSNSVGFSALCELTPEFDSKGYENMGAIPISGDEAIIVEMTGLVAAQTYSVNGIEYPTNAKEVVNFETKKILQGEVKKEMQVPQYNMAIFSDDSSIDELHCTFLNGKTTEYSLKELRAISKDTEGVYGFDLDGSAFTDSRGVLILPLEGIATFTIRLTGAREIELTLMSF